MGPRLLATQLSKRHCASPSSITIPSSGCRPWRHPPKARTSQADGKWCHPQRRPLRGRPRARRGAVRALHISPRDKRTDEDVVLKEFVLPVFVDINARRQSLENFEKEAKLLSSLEHPQVVKLGGFFVEDHRAYLVLEHIDGENLRQIVRARRTLCPKKEFASWPYKCARF